MNHLLRVGENSGWDSTPTFFLGESVKFIDWRKIDKKRWYPKKQRLIRSCLFMQVSHFFCLCATYSPDQIYIAVIGMADADGVC